ncbi:MAG TPA: prenyltransferase/squalene oxidase repeat-containing protein [Solirubrobacterales bacterium]|jgi:energy-coupling factor transport system substrate-specific component|nr:prenyltransferase/squalene oxidase repeat-containing protein [Solirubrobacterales bacterium]
MSWELTSFLILGAVLVGGFVWYERSRPPSQVVALVAALAALAIAGRIAFAAFPNVKPTTDIVIFAGYALGPAPGFAVGALAALVSNFWFGQGPWTPWQMAGWGLCGILGAAVALGGRNVGRLGLAAICGFAGVAYGALLNFSLMATYGGDLSLRHFGLLEVRAVPFDAAHAIGNIVFALIAGPAMVRMLIRFRERFEWERGGASVPRSLSGGLGPGLRRGEVVGIVLIALVLAGLAPGRAQAAGVASAANWLQAVQNHDGGYGATTDDGSDAAMTGWAMLGLEAAGRNPLDVAIHGHTPVDFLRSAAGELKSPGDLARTIIALEGAGVDPRQFAGQNLVSELLAKRRDNGSFEGWPGSTAYGVIALRSAEATGGLEQSLSWLNKVQNDDGGWGDVPGSPSTADGTGAVLQALSPGSKASHRGLSYLREAQHSGGGFPLGGGGLPNTQSTAWAIQGILAAGGDPGAYRRGGKSAPDYLAAQQASDGHYRYSKSSDQTPIWVTSQVLVAAAGDYLPLAVPPRKPKPAKPQSREPSPSTVTPAPSVVSPVVPPEPESSPSTGSATGSAGSPPERFATPGQPNPGAPAGNLPPGVERGRGPGAPATEPPASEVAPEPTESTEPAADEPSSSSTAGAILMGLLAGCLLFAAALGIRRWWMHWRYGW